MDEAAAPRRTPADERRTPVEKGVDLITSQPVVLTYPLALAIATGLTQALSSGLWNRPNFWAWITALILSLVIYGLDWLANRESWKQEERIWRFVLYTFLNTAILGCPRPRTLLRTC